ncbi:unnamed protein product [Chondrus crispus]|uniref:Uncharacterized protein n=1 Tax=Chondrus crispus TaxID=2769 RepID=R7QLH2_CHOCR|nr:unnamed protein product [Chondrus crispus]CDF38250.1 unnamed protein product [Chondrus crispus]|eukprot:XP_005718135.1 unnamed protein product [Chondrus crispus]
MKRSPGSGAQTVSNASTGSQNTVIQLITMSPLTFSPNIFSGTIPNTGASLFFARRMSCISSAPAGSTAQPSTPISAKKSMVSLSVFGGAERSRKLSTTRPGTLCQSKAKLQASAPSSS